MEWKFWQPKSTKPELEFEVFESVGGGLPTARQILIDHVSPEKRPHFFVGENEGVAVAFNSERVDERCGRALERLIGKQATAQEAETIQG